LEAHQNPCQTLPLLWQERILNFGYEYVCFKTALRKFEFDLQVLKYLLSI
jgi:hypothetical protein